MKRISRIIAAAAVAYPTLVSAQVFTKIDKSHTSIEFSAEHFGLSTTPGRFKAFSGDIMIDSDAPENSTVNFTVDAASIDTGWDARDEHLRNQDFFNVSEYPEITFQSKSVEKIDDTRVRVTGDLTLIGETHEEVFDVVINKIGTTPFSPTEIVGLTATSTIDRTKYGMTYGAPGVSSEIPITVNMEVAAE